MAEAVLDLDISEALDQIAQLGELFDAIISDFGAGLTASISTGIDELGGGFSDLGGDISSALDGSISDSLGPQIDEISAQFAGVADTAAGDFTEAFSGIDTGSLGDANQDVSDLSSGLEELQGQAAGSSQSLDTTASAAQGLQAATSLLEGSSKGLLATVAPGVGLFVGIGAAIGGVVEKADRAELAVARMKAVFGDQATEVFDKQLEGLNLSLGELNTKAGGSNSALRLALATFGQTAISAGATKKEAGDVSRQMGELAAVVTTLNPALGTADQNFQLLSRGLGGSTRVLQRYGITIDAAQQKQLALAIAHDHGRDSVTLFDKQVAGSTLALDALNKQAAANGTTLQGELNEGLNSSTIKFRAFKQEISTALVQIGEPLIKPVLEMTEQLTPVLITLMQTVGKLAATILPAFLPLTQAIVDVVSALQPLLDLVGEMPSEFGTVVAAFVALKVVGGPLGGMLQGLGERFQGAAVGAGIAGDAIEGRVGKAFRAVEVGAGTLGDKLKENSGNLLAAAAAGLVAVQSFDEIGKSTEGSIVGIGAMVTAGYQLGETFGNPALGAGIGALAGGITLVGHAIFDAGESAEQTRNRLAELSTELDKLGTKQAAKKFMDDLINNTIEGKVKSLNNELMHLAETSPDAAQKVVEGFRQMQAAGQVHFSNKDFEDMNSAIDKGATHLKTWTANSKEAKDSNDKLTGSVDATTSAVNANQQAIDAMSSSLAQAAESGLPGVSGAFDEAANAASTYGQALSPELLLGGLQQSLATAVSFTSNLRTIFDAGFTDLGVLLQQKGAVAGGNVTQSIADAIRSGNPTIAQQLNDSAQQVNTAGQLAANYAKTQGAAVVANQQGEYAKLSPIVGYYMGLSAQQITDSSPQLQTAATVAAKLGVHLPFTSNLAAVPAAAGQAMTDAAGQVQGATPQLAGAAQGSGTATAGGFSQGVDGMQAGTQNALAGVQGLFVGSFQLLSVAALAGQGVGAAFSAGIAVGIEGGTSGVTTAAEHVVGAAKTAADRKAGVASPSKLFAELGDNLALGVAMGISRTTPNVEGTMRALVTRSASPSLPTAAGVAAGAATAASAAGAGLGGGVGHMENNFFGVKDGKDAIDELSWKLRTTGR